MDRAPARASSKGQWVDLVSYLPGDILVKVDRAAWPGIEVRVPLSITSSSSGRTVFPKI